MATWDTCIGENLKDMLEKEARPAVIGKRAPAGRIVGGVE
jgi:hypothetical protein